MRKTAILAITAFILIGCGSGNSTDTHIDKKSKAHFGLLSNATIKIYELGGTKKLIYSDTTTTGDTLDSIGNFKTNTVSFETAKFYQYEVRDGENWDVDKDGVKDEKATPNTQIFRAIYKGKNSHVAWWGIQTEGAEKVSEEL